MKYLIFLTLIVSTLNAQTTKQVVCDGTIGLGFTGPLSGYYVAPFITLTDVIGNDLTLTAREVNIDGITSLTRTEIRIVDCDCIDNYTPGIYTLLDSCIRDEEWVSGGYSTVLTDSSAFFSPEAMTLFNKFGIQAIDDCGVEFFFVKELEIIPPGTGTSRPGTSVKEFKITFRAVDYTGKVDERVMYWRRSESCGT